MRFYNQQHRHYCGIDLHVKTMYVCIQGCPVIATWNVRKRLKRREIGAVLRPDDIFREGSDSGQERRAGPVDQNDACWLVARSSPS